jgi:tRNA A-37 threonylcarbamoyl transferase component Bud32
MAEQYRCPECEAELPVGSPEVLCPKCAAALRSGAATEESPIGGLAAGPTPGFGTFVPPAVASLSAHFPQLEILELLGHGGMGAVYKARQKNLDRLVALKIIRPESANTPAFTERFNREARMLARLSHPQIVAIYDFGEVSVSHPRDSSFPPRNVYFFLMEYVDGSNLRQLMRLRALPPEQALMVVPQICEALQFAHDEGIVHRDVKPENILLDKRGRVKIADFGLAKLAARSSHDFTLTATHQVLGTARYMAPEQMEGSHAVDHRADIYSLGVVFYEMLTGEVPAGHFEPPSKRVDVDVRIDEVVLRALAREPERRYQHASDLKNEVESICKMPPMERTLARSAEAQMKLQSLIAPAVGMLIVGIALTLWLGLALLRRLPSDFEDWWVIGLGGPVLLLGGIVVSQGRGYWLAFVSSLTCLAIGFATLYFIFMLPFVPLFILFVGGYLLWQLMQPDVQDVFRQNSRNGVLISRRRFVITLTIALPMLALLCALPLFTVEQQLAQSRSSSDDRRVAMPVENHGAPTPPAPSLADHPATIDRLDNWATGPDGPRLAESFARVTMELDPAQTDQVNRILQVVYAEYLAVEQQHVEKQTLDNGRVVIRIEPHSEAVAELEDRLWSQLDAILNSQQQRRARLNLRLDPLESRAGVPLADLVEPGFFGWGKSGAKIEIWRVGTWYHWKVETNGHEYDTKEYPGEAPQLPEWLRRFWNEPVQAEDQGDVTEIIPRGVDGKLSYKRFFSLLGTTRLTEVLSPGMTSLISKGSNVHCRTSGRRRVSRDLLA